MSLLLELALDCPSSPAAHQAESSAVGSLAYDLERTEYPLRFDDAAAFTAWFSEEKRSHTVEYTCHKTERDARQPPQWLTRVTYICNRGKTTAKGSKPTDDSESKRRVPSKRTKCRSRVTVKTYPNSTVRLVRYAAQHDHETGEENLKFTRLSEDTKTKIRMMVRLGMERKKIMAELQSSAGTVTRENMVTSQDVRRVERAVEENISRFARDDITSLRLWVKKLQGEGHYAMLKCRDEHVPGFDDDLFMLIIQTTYQRDCWLLWGSRFAGLDATHNTTFYENMHLFTIMCRDNWGKGMPAAWLISSSGRQTAIEAFLRVIHSLSPSVQPRYFMSDKDHAQMNAILVIYPRTILYLCWWHVLRAWRQRFSTEGFSELWTLMRRWVRVTDQAAFDAIWQRIRAIAPQSVIEFLEKNWMGDVKLWSGVYRTERDIFALCDTNMLVEAWHRLLKHYFMGSKHGRRVDQLVYVLTSMAVPYFQHRHLRQRLGFEGVDLAQAALDDARKAGEAIKAEDVVADAGLEQVYSVRSQTHREKSYIVHIGSASNCTCPAFPRVLYCKHIRAVQRVFCPKLRQHAQSVAALDSDSADADDDPCEVDKDEDFAAGTATVTAVTGEQPAPNHHLVPPERNVDTTLLDRLHTDVAWMALRLLQAPSLPSSLALRGLADALTVAIEDVKDFDKRHSAALPPRKYVAPRQTQQTLTTAAMGVNIKGADKRGRKRQRFDGVGDVDELPVFEAGEESGLKAKPDARGLAVTSSGNFDATTFKIDDVDALKNLIYLQLKALCEHHHLSSARGDGKEDRMRQRLTAHAPSCRCTDPHPPPSDDPDPHSIHPSIPSTSSAYNGQPTTAPTSAPHLFQQPPSTLPSYTLLPTQPVNYYPNVYFLPSYSYPTSYYHTQ